MLLWDGLLTCSFLRVSRRLKATWCNRNRDDFRWLELYGTDEIKLTTSHLVVFFTYIPQKRRRWRLRANWLWWQMPPRRSWLWPAQHFVILSQGLDDQSFDRTFHSINMIPHQSMQTYTELCETLLWHALAQFGIKSRQALRESQWTYNGMHCLAKWSWRVDSFIYFHDLMSSIWVLKKFSRTYVT